jgi:cytochrome P450
MFMDMAGYSPTDPAVLADPYAYYAELRRGPAARYVELDDLWVVSRFEEVGEAIRDPATFSSKSLWALFGGMISARENARPNVRDFAATQPHSLIALDPPEHIPMRRLAAKMFTKRAVDGYAALIRDICEELIDTAFEHREGSEIDLVERFHHPLPIRVIADILGIETDRRSDFRRWSDILIHRLSGRGDSPEERAELKQMMEYFNDIIRQRRKTRGEDLISLIITGNEEAGEFLTDWDLFNFCALLLSAGNETTTNLLGNLFNAFFLYPDQFTRARELTDLSPLVEEILRWESTVQGIVRLTNAEVRVGDSVIPPDAIVLLQTGSANRDETRWPEAERFNIDRPALPHLGFGTGIHHCLGAALARLETEIATDVLLRRCAVIEPAGPAGRTANIILRGFRTMPVRIKAACRSQSAPRRPWSGQHLNLNRLGGSSDSYGLLDVTQSVFGTEQVTDVDLSGRDRPDRVMERRKAWHPLRPLDDFDRDRRLPEDVREGKEGWFESFGIAEQTYPAILPRAGDSLGACRIQPHGLDHKVASDASGDPCGCLHHRLMSGIDDHIGAELAGKLDSISDDIRHHNLLEAPIAKDRQEVKADRAGADDRRGTSRP